MIDLRSDTVTQPTQEMRQAMAKATVGDDVYQDDPTVAELEKEAAAMVGKEAALFVPSGTMGNQLAIMANTRRGDEIIVGYNSHIVTYEVGGASVLSGVGYRLINNSDNTISAEDVNNSIRPNDIHLPTTSLLCLENALCNGTVVPLATMEGAYKAAKKHNIPVHLDGARLFNASLYLGVDAKEVTKYCDTVMFCISKGLCAPVGSLLCGDEPFVARARKYRKMLGGGMRQAGILAAAGLISLQKMTKRLGDDHENAQHLTNALVQLPYIDIDKTKVHISMVFFHINKPINDGEFVNYMLKNGVKINGAEDGNKYRFVTHNDVTKADTEKAINLLKGYIENL
ncbi:MAG: low-specificity L-threonine aldolase [Defluviitaleaceae bacterium]|nr:low-specificity L-threonine aldolase [Defluviitaleaceae bacterium]